MSSVHKVMDGTTRSPPYAANPPKATALGAGRATPATPARSPSVRDNPGIKEGRIGDGEPAPRFLVCHNPDQAARDQAARERQVAQVTAELDRIARLRAKVKRPPKGNAKGRQVEDHVKAECALREHPT